MYHAIPISPLLREEIMIRYPFYRGALTEDLCRKLKRIVNLDATYKPEVKLALLGAIGKGDIDFVQTNDDGQVVEVHQYRLGSPYSPEKDLLANDPLAAVSISGISSLSEAMDIRKQLIDTFLRKLKELDKTTEPLIDREIQALNDQIQKLHTHAEIYSQIKEVIEPTTDLRALMSQIRTLSNLVAAA